MFFQDWTALFRILLIGVLAYAALVFLLRISGKRTLSKWNAFDLVVTVALGSSLATVILSKKVSFLQGVLAFGVLVLLQFIVTWLSVRNRGIQRLIKAKPALLLRNGEFLAEAMRRERVTESEIRAALRGRGYAAVEQIDAVILETDGSFSIIGSLKDSNHSALKDVDGFENKDRR